MKWFSKGDRVFMEGKGLGTVTDPTYHSYHRDRPLKQRFGTLTPVKWDDYLGQKFPLCEDTADLTLVKEVGNMSATPYQYPVALAFSSRKTLIGMIATFENMHQMEVVVDETATPERKEYLETQLAKMHDRLEAMDALFLKHHLTNLSEEELNLFTGGYKNEEHVPGGRPFRY